MSDALPPVILPRDLSATFTFLLLLRAEEQLETEKGERVPAKCDPKDCSHVWQ